MLRKKEKAARPPGFPPPGELRLSGNRIDVWLTSVADEERLIPVLTGMLSEDERERFRHLSSDVKRHHSLIVRSVLRLVLARYLPIRPEDFVFASSPDKKPALAGAGAESGLRYNLSHSHGLLLCGITAGAEIGVDIEKMRPGYTFDKIARRHFSPGEYTFFRNASTSEKIETFFTVWTRKEAFLKALGTGLHTPLNAFDVAAPGEPVEFLTDVPGVDITKRWYVSDLAAVPGYRAAVCTDGVMGELARYRVSIGDLLFS